MGTCAADPGPQVPKCDFVRLQGKFAEYFLALTHHSAGF